MIKGHGHNKGRYEKWRHSTDYDWTVVTQPMIEQLKEESRNKQCSSFDIPGITSEYQYDVNLFELVDTETDAEAVEDLTIPINRNDNFIMRSTIPIPYLASIFVSNIYNIDIWTLLKLAFAGFLCFESDMNQNY